MSPKKPGQSYHSKYVTPPYLVSDLTIIDRCTGNDEVLKSVVYNFLNRQSDPLTYALELLLALKLTSKKKCAKRLHVVLETFRDWSDSHDIRQLLTFSQKANAIEKAVLLSSEIITKQISAIFCLHEDSDYVKHVIYNLLSERKYKEAFYLMSSLDLEKEFTLQEFAFPAFFLDQEHLVKSYLQKCSNLQLPFLKTLDSLYQNPAAVHEFVRSLNIGSLDKNKPFYNPKWMKKRIPSYIEFLNIDIRECPNVYFSRVQGAMHYLIRKRYVEESIEPEAFEELVADLVADHPSLQRELLVKLVCCNDSPAAFMLANIFNLNKNQWPDCLRSIPPPSDEFISLYYRGPQLKNCSDFLPLRLSRHDIHFVDTLEKYVHAVNDISENYDVVGIDAEWKPNLGVSGTKLSLLQVAIWDAVYLFDVQTLTKTLKKAQWDHIIKNVLFNEEILKLGYGLENDLRELIKVIGFEKESYSKCSPLVDLRTAFEKLKNNYPDVINEAEIVESSTDEETDSKGLSHLCKTVLGKPLNKGEQFSNWERRPLRESQIVYSALDAYCILMIYEKLYHILKNLNLSLNKLVTLPMSTPKPKKESPNPKTFKPVAVENFKVVTDCMLGGLGKYLRMFGADVVCLNDGDDPRCALEIGLAQKRVILTCGSRYEKLKGYMPEDMIFCVDNKVELKRQVAEIQRHFNLQLDESTLFSRCSICNGRDYLKVQNEEMFSIWCKLVDDETKWLVSNSKRRISTCYKCDFVTSDGVEQRNVSVQLATLAPKVFETVKEFLICTGCGKIYWEGSHLSRLKDSVSSVIEIKPSEESFYKVLSKESTNDSTVQTGNTSGIGNKSDIADVPCSKSFSHFLADESSEDEVDDIVFC